MNQTNIKIGLGSSIIIIVGCILKAFHLHGAGALITSGYFLFSLVFIPAIIYAQLKEGKIFNSIGYLIFSSLMVGVLFKVMHWPYANFLITWSVTIALFALLPLYFIRIYAKKINEEYNNQDRVKEVFIASFIFAALSMWYLMIDLNQTPSPYSLH